MREKSITSESDYVKELDAMVHEASRDALKNPGDIKKKILSNALSEHLIAIMRDEVHPWE